MECHIRSERNLNIDIRLCFFNVMSWKTCKREDIFIPLLPELLILLLDIERNLENYSYFILRLCVREVFEVFWCFFFPMISMQTFLLKKPEWFLIIFPFMVSHVLSHVIAFHYLREISNLKSKSFSKLKFNYASKYSFQF